MAFDDLYCVAFQMMDAQWLAKRASYMEFNVNHLSKLYPVHLFNAWAMYWNELCSLSLTNLPLLVIFILYFQDVLKSTRTQLERELALEDVSNVRDLPAYNLLKR